MARIGFAREAWTVSEDAGEVILLAESDGLNVDPMTVVYLLNGTGTAQGCLTSYVLVTSGWHVHLSLSLSLFFSLSLFIPPSH